MKSLSVGSLFATALVLAPAAMSAPPADRDMVEYRDCNRVFQRIDGAPPNLPTETPYRVRHGSSLEFGFYIRVESCGGNRPGSWTLAEKSDAPTSQFYALKLLDGTRDDFVVRVADEELHEYFIYSAAQNYRRVLYVLSAGGEEVVKRSGNRDQLLISRITEVDCGRGRRANLPMNSARLVAIDASVCRPR